MKYKLIGNTYAIKEDLKAFKCTWNPVDKCWVTPNLEKEDTTYLRIKSLGESFDFDLVPIHLHPELQKIQDILGR